MNPEKFWLGFWALLFGFALSLALGLGLGLTSMDKAEEAARRTAMLKLIDQGVAPTLAACTTYNKSCVVDTETTIKRTTVDKVQP